MDWRARQGSEKEMGLLMNKQEMQHMMLSMRAASDQLEAKVTETFDKLTVNDAKRLLIMWSKHQHDSQNASIVLAMDVAILWLLRSMEADLEEQIDEV